MGPVFRRTVNIAAGAASRPLQDESWIYRVLPFNALVRMNLESNVADLVATFSSGSDIQLGPDDPVQSGGTIGVFDKDLANFDEFLGALGDELNLVIRNTGGVANDVNIQIRLEPIV